MTNAKLSAPPLQRASEIAELLATRDCGHDRDGVFAADNIADLRDAGFLALNVPVSHGGTGADLEATTETLRTIAQGSASTALMLTMHTSTLSHFLLPAGAVPEAHREHFINQREWAWREAVEGGIFAVANSEPGAAGEVRNSKARVTVNGGRTVFNGVKSFASFGTNADYYMAAARTDEERVDYFLVANDGTSVHAESEWDATGMRSSESIVLRFTNAPVVGPLAYPGLLDGANNRHWATLSFVAVLIGTAEGFLDDAVASSSALLQQTEAVELHLALQASRSMMRHLTREEQPDEPEYKRLVRDCKLFVSRTLAKQATAVFAAQTGRAYARSSSMSRRLRDLLAGPALRPPVGVSFEEVWGELSGSHSK